MGARGLFYFKPGRIPDTSHCCSQSQGRRGQVHAVHQHRGFTLPAAAIRWCWACRSPAVAPVAAARRPRLGPLGPGVDADWISAPPKQATHAVLDTPASLGGWRLKGRAEAGRPHHRAAAAQPVRHRHRPVPGRSWPAPAGWARGHRRHARRSAHHRRRKLRNFVAGQPGPAGAGLSARNAQNYVQLAARGSRCSTAGTRGARDVE